MESYYESRPDDPPGTYYYFDSKRPVMKREGGRSFKYVHTGIPVTDVIDGFWFLIEYSSEGMDITDYIIHESSNETDPPPSEPWDECRYGPPRPLGTGTQASVSEYKEIKTGRAFAIKQYTIAPEAYANARPDIIREIAIMSKVSQDEDASAHMVRLIRWHEMPETATIRLVMHPVASDGSLLHILISQIESNTYEDIIGDGFVEETLRNLARGLAAIHSHTVRHKDINTENILIHRGKAIYSDFGISLYHDSSTSAHKNSSSKTQAESPLTENTYAAPELLDGIPRTTKSDVFSLGCVIWEILVACSVVLLRKKDYVSETGFGNFWEDVKGDGYAKQLREGHLTAAFLKMKNERKMRQYQWIVDVIERMTKDNPNERISASRAYELTRAHENARGLSDSEWRWKLALEEQDPFVEGKIAGKLNPRGQSEDVYQGQGTLPSGLRSFETRAYIDKNKSQLHSSVYNRFL